MYTVAHGRVQTVYTAVHGPRTWSVRDPITAVYVARTRPCTVNMAVFTARVHGIIRIVYKAVHRVYGSCTPACKGRVHGASTAMYRVHVHGRVLCTRPCLRPVYTATHGRVQTVYTAVHGPCTRSVRDRVHGRVYGRVDGRVYGRVDGRVYGPCARRCTYGVYGRVHGRSRHVRTVYTGVQRPCT